MSLAGVRKQHGVLLADWFTLYARQQQLVRSTLKPWRLALNWFGQFFGISFGFTRTF
jgi:hypothetical protein